MPDRRGVGEHPPLEVLSAYVDGTLEIRERGDVETHLAACEECYELVTEVVASEEDIDAEGGVASPAAPVPESPVAPPASRDVAPSVQRSTRVLPFTRRKWVLGAAAGLAIAASALLALRVSNGWLFSGSHESTFSDLVAATGDERTIEGRLTGGFRYAPYRTVVRGPEETLTTNLSLLAAAGVAERDAASAPTVDRLHAWGLAQLLVGRTASAIETLERAVSQERDNAMLHADLAAAYLTSADRLERPDQVPRALDEVETALKLRPDLAEAMFTRAILLQRLGLLERAAAAWRDYLARDPDSPWAEEARKRLAAIPPASSSLQREEVIQRLTSGEVAAGDIESLTLKFADDAPELVIAEILARGLRLADDSRRRYANLAAQIAESSSSGLPIARQTSTLLSGPTLSSENLTALLALAEGTRAVRADEYARGEMSLQIAMRTLHAPLERGWAAFQLARVRFFQGRYDDASKLLNEALMSSRSSNDRPLEARATWIRGLVAFSQGRWREADEDYRKALVLFTELREQVNAANVQMNLAVLFRFLGDPRQAWTHRIAALQYLPWHIPSRAQSFLITSAVSALLAQHPHAAVAFISEAIDKSGSGVLPQNKAVALVQRARLLAATGQKDAAARDLAEASRTLAGVNDRALSTRIGVALDTATAEVFHQSESSKAAVAARRAIDVAAERGDMLRAAEAYLYLGKALAAEGDVLGARRAFRSGVRDFEATRRSVALSNASRLSAFEPVWDLFDELFEACLLRAPVDKDAAFEAFAQGRARTLIETRGDASTTLEGLQSTLDGDEAVLLFHQRSTVLVGWLIQNDRDEVIKVDLDRESASRLAARTTNEASSSAPPVAALELYERILQPFVQSQRGPLSVTIVPDAPFYRIPWSYVLQSSRAQASWTIAVAPSPVLAHGARSRPDKRLPKALIFGAPVPSPGFSALPNALREITAVAQIYTDRSTRTGLEATRHAFIELAGEADVVHVAAHGVDNPTYPTLSRLVLSPDSERRVDFTVEDIRREVKFSRRPLVVLAACSTMGSGSLKGEGSIGLAWAFLMSGAQGVVATLWEIDDAESATMFVDLHRALSKGVAPSVAVRETQEAARRRGAPASVWAAIQLVGRA